MAACVERRHTRGRRISEHAGDEVRCLGWGVGAEDLAPRVGLDRGELEVRVVLVHCFYVLTCWSAEHLDYFNKLVYTGLTREKRLPNEQLREHTSQRPHVDGRGVVRCAKDQLWCPVVA